MALAGWYKANRPGQEWLSVTNPLNACDKNSRMDIELDLQFVQ